MEKNIIWVVAILAIVVVIIAGLWAYNDSMSPQGRFVATLTDAAKDLNGVTQINVTIDSVRAQNDANAWVTLDSTQQTVDLLQLKRDGSKVVIADLNIPATNYNQIELNISKVIVVDASGSHEAKLPSNKIRINMDVNLAKESTSVASLDVLADESLHVTGNGLYILAPVIHIQTMENARVEIDLENHAVIIGGKLKNDIKVGMDENGNVGINVNIPKDTEISIGNDNKIHVGLN